jgi:hypothetical protein
VLAVGPGSRRDHLLQVRRHGDQARHR